MSAPNEWVDAEARRRIAEELGTTFLVEAAAGTGKTTALVSRMLAAVEAGARLDAMVAVTFTDKAAGELIQCVIGDADPRHPGLEIVAVTVDYPPVNAIPSRGWFDLADAVTAAGRDPRPGW